jgi:hypothetical protein
MKKTLITCSLYMLIIGSTAAQVLNTDFMAKVDALNAAWDNKGMPDQKAAYDEVIKFMNKQVMYMAASVDKQNKEYNTAIEKANKDLSEATKEHANVVAEIKQNNSTSNSKTDADSRKATDDKKAADAEFANVKQLKAELDGANRVLKTERDDWDKASRAGAGKAHRDEMNTWMKEFASTLH